jgi:hypothetical protein
MVISLKVVLAVLDILREKNILDILEKNSTENQGLLDSTSFL